MAERVLALTALAKEKFAKWDKVQKFNEVQCKEHNSYVFGSILQRFGHYIWRILISCQGQQFQIFYNTW